MEQQPNDQSSGDQPSSKMPIGIGAAMAIGVALGVAMDNIPVGLAIGVAIGSGIGVSLDRQIGATSPYEGVDKRAAVVVAVGGRSLCHRRPALPDACVRRRTRARGSGGRVHGRPVGAAARSPGVPTRAVAGGDRGGCARAGLQLVAGAAEEE